MQLIQPQQKIRLEHMLFLAIVIAFALVLTGISDVHAAGQRTFQSAEDAVKAMMSAVRANDTRSLLRIMGPGSRHIVISGDRVDDNNGREWFAKHYDEKNKLEAGQSGNIVLHVGKEDWPFPIPIIKTADGWKFDARTGRNEILARRVGRNELSAIQVCLAYVDAQKEYAARKGREGNGLLEYAQRFTSKPGNKDGLYWEAGEGEEQSPMGPLFAAAREEGYGEKPLRGKATPYHGYFYRILKGQGDNASGGARDYIVGDKMIAGFALIAYPAHYRSSGVMTFIVNQDGMVYQKDFGKGTKQGVRDITVFDPDKTWTKVPE